MDKKISKEMVFEKLFNAYNYGNLGMFVGAGFSKAVIGDQSQPALGWYEQIMKVCEEFEIDIPDDRELIGVSLPELATKMCKNLASKRAMDYGRAKHLFKKEICNLSNWIPNEQCTSEYREIFDIPRVSRRIITLQPRNPFTVNGLRGCIVRKTCNNFRY